MKLWVLAAAALLFPGCFPDFENPHLSVRGLSEEDLKAPPGRVEIKSAIVNDVRNRRSLRLSLNDGRNTPPPELKFDRYGVEATRAKDGFELWRVTVWSDPTDRLYAVTEIAYWDNEENSYFYHYEGGNPHRDVWMGPFPIKFSKPPADMDEHGH
ncbi:MAG TPA: hypothetical protein VFC90_07645 [Planctomycetota bacterium]|nr:hypothetical protein [Planctomycetota bacterium]